MVILKITSMMLHKVLDVLSILSLCLAGLGLFLSILSLILPKCRQRDRFMYFGARVLVGSIIVALISLVLARHTI